MCAVLVFAADSADAKGAHRGAGSTNPIFMPAFRISASNGFSAVVVSERRKRARNSEVVVEVFDSHTASTYSTRGHVDDHRIQADFGAFGTVNIRFRQHGTRHVRDRCSSRTNTYADGRFTGAFDFRVEGGYTDFGSNPVDAAPLYQLLGPCGGSEAAGGVPGVRLEVFSKYGTTKVIQNRPGGPVRVIARSGTEYEGVTIEKLVEVFAPPTAFRWSADLKRATLTPPAPFSGTATYEYIGEKNPLDREPPGRLPGLPPDFADERPFSDGIRPWDLHRLQGTTGGHPGRLRVMTAP